MDYSEWSIKLNIKFDVNAYYMPDEEEKDADAASVKGTLWHVFDTFSREELKDIPCNRTDNVQLLMGVLMSDLSADQLTVVLNESIVALRENLLHIHACISRHRLNLDEGEELYRHERRVFGKGYESRVIEEFEEWKENSCDGDEAIIKRNLKGKYCTEMLNLFMSGFLAPRISAQAETDTTEFESEFKELRFYNVPPTIVPETHYSALRELFDYKDGVVVPKKGHIGKYFFKHRKEVDAKQRFALFAFIRMTELIEKEKKPKMEVSRKTNPLPEISSKNLFYSIIQYEDPDKLVGRLHQLIDGRKGADVGCVLLKCLQDGFIIRKPKQKEFESEFTLVGGWTAIHNYMNDNDENALDRANKIIIF